MRILAAPWLDANWAFALLVAGVVLVYVECCRPGTVIAGAAGGALILVAAARFWDLGLDALGVSLITAGALVWLVEGYYRWPGLPGLAGALLIAWGATRLRVRWWVAGPLSVGLGVVTVLLVSIAIRGYLAKRES